MISDVRLASDSKGMVPDPVDQYKAIFVFFVFVFRVQRLRSERQSPLRFTVLQQNGTELKLSETDMQCTNVKKYTPGVLQILLGRRGNLFFGRKQ